MADQSPGRRSGVAAMVGNKVPRPHRFHLVDGRVLRGDVFRSPNVRLVDHLSTLKGFIAVVSARFEGTEERFDFVAVNSDNVLFIEEV
jgi:hypothetical protein